MAPRVQTNNTYKDDIKLDLERLNTNELQHVEGNTN